MARYVDMECGGAGSDVDSELDVGERPVLVRLDPHSTHTEPALLLEAHSRRLVVRTATRARVDVPHAEFFPVDTQGGDAVSVTIGSEERHGTVQTVSGPPCDLRFPKGQVVDGQLRLRVTWDGDGEAWVASDLLEFTGSMDSFIASPNESMSVSSAESERLSPMADSVDMDAAADDGAADLQLPEQQQVLGMLRFDALCDKSLQPEAFFVAIMAMEIRPLYMLLEQLLNRAEEMLGVPVRTVSPYTAAEYTANFGPSECFAALGVPDPTGLGGREELNEAEQELPHRVAALQHGLTFLNAALSEYMRKAHLRSDRSSDVENALHRRAGLLWEAFVFKTREVVSWFSLVRGCQGVETAVDPDAKRGGLEVLANTALGRARRMGHGIDPRSPLVKSNRGVPALESCKRFLRLLMLRHGLRRVQNDALFGDTMVLVTRAVDADGGPSCTLELFNGFNSSATDQFSSKRISLKNWMGNMEMFVNAAMDSHEEGIGLKTMLLKNGYSDRTRTDLIKWMRNLASADLEDLTLYMSQERAFCDPQKEEGRAARRWLFNPNAEMGGGRKVLGPLVVPSITDASDIFACASFTNAKAHEPVDLDRLLPPDMYPRADTLWQGRPAFRLNNLLADGTDCIQLDGERSMQLPRPKRLLHAYARRASHHRLMMLYDQGFLQYCPSLCDETDDNLVCPCYRAVAEDGVPLLYEWVDGRVSAFKNGRWQDWGETDNRSGMPRGRTVRVPEYWHAEGELDCEHCREHWWWFEAAATDVLALMHGFPLVRLPDAAPRPLGQALLLVWGPSGTGKTGAVCVRRRGVLG